MTLQTIQNEFVKLRYLVGYSIRSAQAGGLANILSMFATVVLVVVQVYVWKLGNASTAIFSYLLIGRLYKSLAENYFIGTMSSDIISGNLSRVLLLPSSTMRLYYFLMVGKRVFRNLIEFFGFVIATVICVNYFVQIEYNLGVLWILVLFLPITFTINHFTGMIVGCLAFIISDKRDFTGIDNIYYNMREVLGGRLIPLNLLPFSGFFIATPFAWQLHYPMQIYLGVYQGWDIVKAWIYGVLWCLALYFIASFVFRVGLKSNESSGL